MQIDLRKTDRCVIGGIDGTSPSIAVAVACIPKKTPGNREKSKKKTYVTDPGQYSTTCSISAPCASRGLRMSKAASDRAKDSQIDMSAISLPGHTRRPNPNAKVRGSGAGAAPR